MDIKLSVANKHPLATQCIKLTEKILLVLIAGGGIKVSIETFDDILEELADNFGVYGAEVRNAWILKMRTRIERAVNHCQLKQTACPCPTRGETMGSLTRALRAMLVAPTKSALEANPQAWQAKEDWF